MSLPKKLSKKEEFEKNLRRVSELTANECFIIEQYDEIPLTIECSTLSFVSSISLFESGNRVAKSTRMGGGTGGGRLRRSGSVSSAVDEYFSSPNSFFNVTFPLFFFSHENSKPSVLNILYDSCYLLIPSSSSFSLLFSFFGNGYSHTDSYSAFQSVSPSFTSVDEVGSFSTLTNITGGNGGEGEGRRRENNNKDGFNFFSLSEESSFHPVKSLSPL